ncbi:hypothetical protein GmHk_11G032681 [Glycine max]|nr:hypothetical protein GmHk_11G032681 [Glycine max]
MKMLYSHPDAVKLTNASNLIFLIDSTYKTNRYKLSLLDIVGVTPTEITFLATFAYLEGERVNNVVWALKRFRGIFLRRDVISQVIVTNRDSTLMNAVKNVFHEATNLLCQFHIDKNVKEDKMSKKCIRLCNGSMGELEDRPSKQEFDDYFMKFEIVCSS